MKTQATRKLIYCANARFPTEKAHGIQIAKMCEAFANCGLDVTLLVPKRFQINPSLKNENPFDYYQVKPNFKIRYLLSLDLLLFPRLGETVNLLAYWIQNLSFALVASIVTLNQNALFYTRSKAFAFLRALLGRTIIYEAHDSARQVYWDKFVAKKSLILIAITQSISKSWKKIRARVFFAPDGVGKEFFINISKDKARRKLNLSHEQTIVLYTGNLYPWKGIEVLFKAAAGIHEVDLYIVGGSQVEDNISPLYKKAQDYRNIHVIGHQPYRLMPLWQKAADVLLLPGSLKSKKGREDTSPLKLFEYMASGRPVIAVNTPAILQIVNQKQVTFFTPDDAADLTQKIKMITSQKAKLSFKTELAQKKAKNYLWDVRAQRIISAVNKIT